MRPIHLAVVLFAVSTIACAAEGDGRGARTFERDLPPGGMAEICLRLEAGKSRAFEWESDRPLEFDIHFHSGEKVSYPVKLSNQRKGKGKFTASTGEDYCWMWTATFATKLTGNLSAEE